MRMLRVSLTAFEDRAGLFIFVAVPNEPGRYLRTDRSVALVACPMCKAMAGEPCKGDSGYHGATHAVRRSSARHRFGRRAGGVDDVVEPAGTGAPS